MKTTKELLKMTDSPSVLAKDFTEEDWKLVEEYRKYYSFIREFMNSRKEQGMTQKELSSKSGIAEETICRIEKGERNPTVETLIALAAAMGKKLEIRLV